MPQGRLTGGRAFIFANGVDFHPAALKPLIRPDDLLIAADGGLRFINMLNLKPDLLIGDLDSLSADEVEKVRAAGIEVRQYPVHKDETDLELAVDAAVKAGRRQIRVVGALGGRLDMTLANIFLLMLPELQDLDARLEDGVDEVFLIRPKDGKARIEGEAGDRLSLLPINGLAEGVFTAGLYYPLKGETLYQERTRGVSNVLLSNEAYIWLRSGLLLCIHTRLSKQANVEGVRE